MPCPTPPRPARRRPPLAHRLFTLPPLLTSLLESLKTTGVLDVCDLEMQGSNTLQRARTIMLPHSIVQEIITFALGPHILHLDSRKPTPPPTPPSSSKVLGPGVPPHAPGLPTVQDHEDVGLLDEFSDASGDEDGDDDGADEEWTIRRRVDIMSSAVPRAVPCKAARVLGIERAKKSTPGKALVKGLGRTWEAAKVWMNLALVGGVIALILGIIPLFHAAFFSPSCVFTNANTKVADNLSGLFGALQMFTLGITLALTPSFLLKAKPTVWVLLVRYVGLFYLCV
ncbi:hypothetical protein FIBSPDRAFT_945613 [Athelia psychrophila]|uniref:Uncharacterized protein n=1 Tax=Athelia psychrophila TaxID=1759441 RepID=A0A166TJE3_9AGAM|nr:hypothetical protein FIBSPDRAFT_945613 [Fibularhizoctonia sp. CBS 109695]